MLSRVPGPAVELVVRVRFPLPVYHPADAELGFASAEDLVIEHLEEMRRDPSFLADLLASDRSEVTYEYELDE